MRINRFLEEKAIFLRFYDRKWEAPSIVHGEIVRRTRDTRKDGQIHSKTRGIGKESVHSVNEAFARSGEMLSVDCSMLV